jgi:hypothetical protein
MKTGGLSFVVLMLVLAISTVNSDQGVVSGSYRAGAVCTLEYKAATRGLDGSNYQERLKDAKAATDECVAAWKIDDRYKPYVTDDKDGPLKDGCIWICTQAENTCKSVCCYDVPILGNICIPGCQILCHTVGDECRKACNNLPVPANATANM